MKKNLLLMIVLLMGIVMMTGCGDKGEGADTKEGAEAGDVVVEEVSWLSALTTISYSAGDDSNWAYGNQRKEFPDNENCYVRVGSTVISGKGKNEDVTITYRFTGTENCNVELSDGIAEKVDTGDKNVVEFVRTVTAKKEKNAKEGIVIFQYTPNGASSITLEVIYDDQVATQYDDRNTIYFSGETEEETKEDSDIEKGIH